MLLNPMPYMEPQINDAGGIDLNCGWYCAKAMIGYWFQKKHGHRPGRVPLPAARTAYGYDPRENALHIWGSTIHWRTNLPHTAAEWEDLLGSYGPVMAKGRLGGADWGKIRSTKMGIRHWILIVGADATADTLSYKDPLKGNALRTENFTHTNDRIKGVRYLDQSGATKVLEWLGDSMGKFAARPAFAAQPALGTIRRPPPPFM
jgi:hypothetical protein